MRKILTFTLLAVFALHLAARNDRTVVIVSWDGAKPSVVRQLVNEGKLTTLKALLPQSSYSWKAKTVIPSSTLPSHASMLTGLDYPRHGITWNTYRPEEGTVKVETVFELAKRANLKTAMVYSKEKFKHFAKPKTLDAEEHVSGDAIKVANVSIGVLEKVKPNLIFIHFSDPDSAGHGYGWGNEKEGIKPPPEYLASLQRCDEALGLIVNAIKRSGVWEKTLLIVTADHGGHNKTHGSADPEDVNIPWIAAGGLASRRGELNRQIKTMDTAATALAALGIRVPQNWDGKPVWEALAIGGEVKVNGKQLQIVSEWKGSHCGIKEPKQIVVNDANEWAELWRKVYEGVVPTPQVPQIDFSKNTVIAVFMGEKRTSGYAVQISKVAQSNGEIIVKVKETSPPKGSILLQVLTQPFHIVVVPKFDAKVKFVKE